MRAISIASSRSWGDPKARLSYLMISLSERSKEVMQDCVLLPDKEEGYRRARDKLHRYFG